MKRHGILNLGLNQAIAAMGHGDYLIVCDAGFPIPSEVPRIDLAVIPDLPDIETVLTAITGAFDPWGNILLYSGVDVKQ